MPVARGFEDDGGDLLQRGEVAQAGGGEELVERARCSARARSRSDGQRRRSDDAPALTPRRITRPAVPRLDGAVVRDRVLVFLFDQPRDRHDLVVALDVDQP